jgi:hypothetical protein
MKQARFNFSEKKPVYKFGSRESRNPYQGAQSGWAHVVAADPQKYGRFMEQLAQKALDRASRMSS